MRVLALIPARGQSKRVPGKNKRALGGKPLICWSIQCIQEIEAVCDVLVSTDDPEIAAIATGAGASVPWMRPSDLATDTATSVDVALHALNWYEQENGVVDGLLLLQPTSPFRTRDTIQRGLEIFRLGNFRPVVAVSPAHPHPMWCVRIEDDNLVPFMTPNGFTMRSQELPPVYAVNGVLYLIAPHDLRHEHSFAIEGAAPIIIDSAKEALDIDTEHDWRCAVAYLSSQ
ncbi:acylneuraminate cytidylyltransferase family protein [uncultured Lamprocystis sp.]|jgi:N-acylneuraminate cytidylyltransferase|uniref:acylneuraminate cytidylyltransferase family protein n=1 Tax=uncultured Lamprocystis sp. TaxID=543132 RepID=UPI0025FAC9BF|nr:acylneuraminate cytidylyltransferase family protein [uncultured Lamprocystis sp.]